MTQPKGPHAMRTLLGFLFGGMLVTMLVLTVHASLDRGMIEAGRELVQHPWFIATLADAYFAFLAFYVWLAWRERSWVARIIWLLLVMCLGSMAIASYVLIELYRDRRWPSRLATGGGAGRLAN
jgi:predicted permease